MSERLWEIMASHLSGESLKREDLEILNEWLKASAENRRAYNDLKIFYQGSRFENTLNIHKAYQEVVRKIKAEKNRRNFNIGKWASVAAVFLFGIALMSVVLRNNDEKEPIIAVKQSVSIDKVVLTLANGVGYYLGESSDEELLYKTSAIYNRSGTLYFSSNSSDIGVDNSLNTITTPVGKSHKIIFGDGSEVWLSAGSSLSFPDNFSGIDRRVKLKGEAYFKISKMSDRPFMVETEKAYVKVLGTEFDVRAYDKEEVFLTTLVKGSVVVSPQGASSHAINLTPSQQYSLDHNTLFAEVYEVDTRVFTAWKDNMFLFRNAPLKDVLREFEIWYGTSFVFEDPKAEEVKISGYFKRPNSCNEVVDMINKLEKVVIVKQNDKFLLTIKKYEKGKN